MGIRSFLTRRHATRRPARSTPEVFDVVHSADLDVHIQGVTRSPTSGPPWASTPWERYTRVAQHEPSAMAKVLLERHPAFVEADASAPTWLEVERAEVLAMEWAMFTPAEAGQWLAAHPAVSAQQARVLAEAGWSPRDAALALPERVIRLDRSLARDLRRTG